LDLRKFSLYNILGAFLWVWSLILGGYFIGRKYPQVIHYLEFIIIGFLAVTTLTLVRQYVKAKKVKRPAARKTAS
jgi:membrane-associated protein